MARQKDASIFLSAGHLFATLCAEPRERVGMDAVEVVLPLYLLFLLRRTAVLLLRFGEAMEPMEEGQRNSRCYHHGGHGAAGARCMDSGGYAERKLC